MSILRRSKILCVALIIAIIATVIAPIGSFTASAAVQNPVSDAADFDKVVDGWYTSNNGGFKFNVGTWIYYGAFGLTLAAENSYGIHVATIGIYDADSDEVFANKTVADFETALGETSVKFEKTTVGNSDFPMIYCQTENFESYLFQAHGHKYFINFIYADGYNGDTREDFTAFVDGVMASIIIADDAGEPQQHKHSFAASIECTSNSSSYPFSLSNGIYTSTNKSDSSSSTVTFTAKGTGPVNIEYYTSTESGYDKLTIKHNSTTKVTASGETSWTSTTINASKGDTISFTYSKDGSASNGSDVVKFKISTNNAAEPTCTESVVCTTCGAVVYEALGHNYTLNGNHTCSTCKHSITPDKPVLESKTYSSVTLTATEGFEYSKNGTSWQTSNVFTGLSSENTYTFYQRVKASDIALVSAKSAGLTVSLKVEQDAPPAPVILNVTDTTITLKAIENGEYSKDGTTWQTSNVFTDLNPKTNYTMYQRKAETSMYFVSPESECLVVKTNELSVAELPFKSVTHEISDDKVIFTVVTSAGDYNRIKVANAVDLSTSLAVSDTFTVNDEGDYVWTVKTNEPLVGTCYAFDLRIAETSKYFKSYLYYHVRTVAEDYDYTIADGEVTINRYKGDGGEVTIPATIEGYPVTTIGGYYDGYNNYYYGAFKYCDSLTSISMPNVTTIGEYAFVYCYSLATVSMPSVTTIGEGAFSDCSSLTNVTMPSTTTIGSSAFSNCDSLISVSMPSVTTIGEGAFYNCDGLTSISMPNVTTIGGTAFYNCGSLTTVLMPNVTTISGSSIFYNCDSLTSVSMPNVTSIGDWAFNGCDSLTSVSMPNITTLGDYAFARCSSLQVIDVGQSNPCFITQDGVLFDKEMTTLLVYPIGKTDSSYIVPDSVTIIDDGAFFECKNLTSIDMPNVETIIDAGTAKDWYWGAFAYCSSLESVNMPNVTTIGSCAFGGCSSLTSVEMPKVTTIGWGAFSGCSSLTNVTMPSTTTIGNSAFSGCSSLTSVEMPEVTTIDYYAFSGCSSLTSVNIPKVTTIGYSAFSGCSSLTSVDMLKITEIGQSAFSHTALTSVDMPEVTTIGKYAFNGCSSLTSVTMPNVSEIMDSAFENCSSDLTIYGLPYSYAQQYAQENSINFQTVACEYDYTVTDGEVTITRYNGPGGNVVIPSILAGYPVTTIGGYYDDYDYYRGAFYNCDSLISVSMPSVTTIGEFAFMYCDSLVSVSMPSVTTIGEEAFYSCDSLTSISMPNVTTIGEYAFDYCGSLTSLDLPSVTTIGRYAFNGCSSLVSVKLPNVTTICEGTFTMCTSLVEVEIPNALVIEGVSGYERETHYYGAFSECESLVSVYMPNVTTIGNYAFYYCRSLTSISMPNVTTIGDYAFDYCSSLQAFDVGESNPYYTTQDGVLFNKDKTTLLLYPYGKNGSYTVPDGVTTIAENAFDNCDRLASITMPDVTTIGDYAFYDCGGLRAVSMPSVTEISGNAFRDCDNLTIYATLDSYAYSYAVTYSINVVVADGCEADLIYTVTDGEATVIGYVGNGGDLVIPSTLGGYPVTTIADNTFSGLSSLTSVSMPSVTTIGDNAFAYCYYLASVSMPNVTTIGARAFVIDSSYSYYASALVDISMPNVITIGDYAFAYRRLQSAFMPKATTIGERAFYDCSSLKTINMSSVVTIGDSAFASCDSMLSVYLPASLENMADNAFPLFTSYTVSSSNKHYSSHSGVLFNKTKTELIRYPQNKGGASYTVPDSVTTIRANAFESCAYLKNISMPNVTTIGDYAFYYGGLTSISMPKVITIGESAFANYQGNVNVTSLDMPCVTTIGAGAFANLIYLDSVNMPNVSTIGDRAFYNCSALTSVNMTNVSEIGNYSFYGCYCLSDVDMANVRTIGNGSFYCCESLTSVNLANVEYIGDFNFIGCDNLTILAPLNSYAYSYALENGINTELPPVERVKSVTHEIVNGKLVFTVVTGAGNYNRVKVSYADDLNGYISYAKTYALNADGDYVWTIRIDEPSENTTYAFDIRNTETSKYLKDYFYYEVEAQTPDIISASHTISDGKIIFTVVTKPGAFSRVKATTADNLGGSLGVAKTYTVDADGNYVWTIKSSTVPTVTTNYAFDLCSAETGKYQKDYFYYECVLELLLAYRPSPTIKSVACEESGDKLVFTVVTKAGDYNRLRCGVSESTVGNLANANTYTVNADGDYVWVIKVAKPADSKALYLDLRDATTGKFIKEFYIYNYTV